MSDYAEMCLALEPTVVGALEHARAHTPAVLWVHESQHRPWRLPARGVDLGPLIKAPPDAMNSPGWWRLARELHVALPLYSGDFAGLEGPADLMRAVRLFHDHAGLQFMYSAPATVLQLIAMKTRLTPVPESGVPYAGSAFAIPAHTWTRPMEREDRAQGAVQLFDRKGSYLAAWRSCELPDGRWTEASVEPEVHVAAADVPGYYLVDVRPIAAYVAAQALYDPFARTRGEELEGAVWLTQPLTRLAADLAEESGVPLHIERAIIAERHGRYLDAAAERLILARTALEGIGDPAADAVVRALKDGYTRATAHLEFGRGPGHPLHRPAWRHTIVERSVANTWRSLRRAVRRPLVVGGIDAAVFAVPRGGVVEGLRTGPEFGSWRRRGEPLSIEAVGKRMRRAGKDAATNAHELIAALQR